MAERIEVLCGKQFSLYLSRLFVTYVMAIAFYGRASNADGIKLAGCGRNTAVPSYSAAGENHRDNRARCSPTSALRFTKGASADAYVPQVLVLNVLCDRQNETDLISI